MLSLIVFFLGLVGSSNLARSGRKRCALDAEGARGTGIVGLSEVIQVFSREKKAHKKSLAHILNFCVFTSRVVRLKKLLFVVGDLNVGMSYPFFIFF